MAETTPDIFDTKPTPEFEDVWSRTESKYRRRAFLLLTLNAFLFAGLGCVAYWLRSGVAFAPALSDYWDRLSATFHPTLDTQHTPLGLSLAPISVEQVPMMVAVVGLVLAALISIPILVAILYRFPSSIPFIAVVGFIAVMPWLAIVLLGSCILASVKPFRFGSRFASALMALLPVILYFFMASRHRSPAVDVLNNPTDQVKLLAPLILAIIASAVVMGIVLITARVVVYRPGAIAPLLAIMFLTPAVLFEFQVGRDELYYRLLEAKFGPGSRYFVGVQIRDTFESAVERAMQLPKNRNRSYGAVRDELELVWSLAMDPDAGQLLTAYQDFAARAADRFVHQFPDSIYACNALYLKGRALDMRIDLTKFRHDREIVFYDDFPNPRSQKAWEKIEFNVPNSPLASEARLKLAHLYAREGRVDEAMIRLQKLELDANLKAPATDTHKAAGGIMNRKPPESSLHLLTERTLFEGRRLKQLLENNRDPLYGDEPLASFLLYDPTQRAYAEQLHRILNRYPKCQLEDNIELIAALAQTDQKNRIAALLNVLDNYPRADAIPEAVYELGLSYQNLGRLADARKAFQRVASEFQNSIWREPAELRLRHLERTATTTHTSHVH